MSAVKRQRSEPAARDLLLEFAARAHEDRGCPRLFPPAALAMLSRGTLGGAEDCLGAGFVDRLVSGYRGHESGSFRGEFSDPDRSVGGDEQQVALGPAEAEVHRPGQPDLTDQLTARIEHLNSGERRAIDPSL